MVGVFLIILGLLRFVGIFALNVARRINDKEQLANSPINIDAYGGEAGKGASFSNCREFWI